MMEFVAMGQKDGQGWANFMALEQKIAKVQEHVERLRRLTEAV